MNTPVELAWSRMDLALREEAESRVAAQHPTRAVVKPAAGRLVGYSPSQRALVYTRQPDLNVAQGQVYEAIMPVVIQRLQDAREREHGEFELMADWEWPDLFRGLNYRAGNIIGNVRSGMEPVWEGVVDFLGAYGFKVAKAAHPWRLIAVREV